MNRPGTPPSPAAQAARNDSGLRKATHLLRESWDRLALSWPVKSLGRSFRATGRTFRTAGRGLVNQAMRVPPLGKAIRYGQEKLKNPRVRNMVLMLVIVGLFFGAIFGFEALMGAFVAHIMAGLGQQPQTVSTVQATLQPWQKTFQAVGSLRAIAGANLSSEESGIVESIDFKSGDDVPAQTVLVTLVAQDDKAKLASLKATARLAAITYRRDLEQFKIQGVSQATLDTDLANLDNANALADQQQAIVDLKVIKAPFAGRLGIRAVDLGQYLSAGTSVVTLQTLDPIFVDFYLPQQQIAQVGVGQKVAFTVDTFPNKIFEGTISSTDPLIDASSRNMQVRATLRNPEHKLLPGMFGSVSINIGQPTQEVTLPQTALAFNPYGTTVFQVNTSPQELSWWQQLWGTKLPPIKRVTQSFVVTGDTRGDQIEIISGVKAGEEVVGAGQIKIHNGSAITIDNSLLPSDQANPVPTAER